MFELFGLMGIGVVLLSLLSGLLALAYAVFVIWMVVDGILRRDAEYPGMDANRKVLWVVGMVLFHPVAIAYYFIVYAKVPRVGAAYTCCAPQTAQVPQQPPVQAPPAPPAG